jgi:hypothetical protein
VKKSQRDISVDDVLADQTELETLGVVIFELESSIRREIDLVLILLLFLADVNAMELWFTVVAPRPQPPQTPATPHGQDTIV